MNTPLAVALGLACVFLCLAHGCLHHFLARERTHRDLPARAALFPWPSRGRAVSCLSLIVSLAFAFLAWQIGVSTPSSIGAVGVFLLLAHPLIVHVAWLGSCMRRRGSTWAFVPRSPTQRSLRIAMAPYAVAAAVGALWEWMN